ncbi:MAG: RnfABCDGE type electron transport complex subunit G [Gammaproteobacteria bacterium]|nr:RnfABCDGE type electron transport complex subunit G [Gammaproteobacteria bacterium]
MGLFLGLVGLLGGGLMVLASWHATPYIDENERRYLLSMLETVAPEGFDNIPADSAEFLSAPEWFPVDGGVTVYRAYRDGAPAAAIFDVHAPDGYTGPIRLLVGVNARGTVSGVRVVSHRETPGLGDGIEVARSPWMLGFNGRSRANTPDGQWRLRRDGGDFDQLTGATVTSRAVMHTVHRTLEFYDTYRERIFPHGDVQESSNDE